MREVAKSIEGMLTEEHKVATNKRGDINRVSVYKNMELVFHIDFSKDRYEVKLAAGITIDSGSKLSHLTAYLSERQMLKPEHAPCAEKYAVTA